jgi:hypothetical protein
MVWSKCYLPNTVLVKSHLARSGLAALPPMCADGRSLCVSLLAGASAEGIGSWKLRSIGIDQWIQFNFNAIACGRSRKRAVSDEVLIAPS